MAGVLKSNRVRAEAGRVLQTLTLARSEAVRLNTPVTICRSSDGASCGGDWANGWIVFSNFDEDNDFDSIDGDTIVRVFEGLGTGYSLGSNLSETSLTYYADGSYAGDGGIIRICSPDGDADLGWSVVLNQVGRSRLSPGTSSCP
jgi:type IV fimbrial biogenesis protein FimT